MSREILTRVRIESASGQPKSGVRMTTTDIETGERNGYPISHTTIDEIGAPSIYIVQTDLSRTRRRLILMQTSGLTLTGAASSFVAAEAITIFNGASFSPESVSRTFFGTVLAVAFTSFPED